MDRNITNRRVKTVSISLERVIFVSPFTIISKYGIRRRRRSNEVTKDGQTHCRLNVDTM